MIYHNAWDSIIGDARHGLSGFRRRCCVAKSADGCAIAACRTEEVDSPAHIVRPARSAGDMDNTILDEFTVDKSDGVYAPLER